MRFIWKEYYGNFLSEICGIWGNFSDKISVQQWDCWPSPSSLGAEYLNE